MRGFIDQNQYPLSVQKPLTDPIVPLSQLHMTSHIICMPGTSVLISIKARDYQADMGKNQQCLEASQKQNSTFLLFRMLLRTSSSCTQHSRLQQKTAKEVHQQIIHLLGSQVCPASNKTLNRNYVSGCTTEMVFGRTGTSGN